MLAMESPEGVAFYVLTPIAYSAPMTPIYALPVMLGLAYKPAVAQSARMSSACNARCLITFVQLATLDSVYQEVVVLVVFVLTAFNAHLMHLFVHPVLMDTGQQCQEYADLAQTPNVTNVQFLQLVLNVNLPMD
jgi:hypothetical protein